MDIAAMQALVVLVTIVSGIMLTELGSWHDDDDGWGF